jgi:hypothetical protein
MVFTIGLHISGQLVNLSHDVGVWRLAANSSASTNDERYSTITTPTAHGTKLSQNSIRVPETSVQTVILFILKPVVY